MEAELLVIHVLPHDGMVGSYVDLHIQLLSIHHDSNLKILMPHIVGACVILQFEINHEDSAVLVQIQFLNIFVGHSFSLSRWWICD